MTFKQALDQAKKGKKIKRKSWSRALSYFDCGDRVATDHCLEFEDEQYFPEQEDKEATDWIYDS